MGTASSDLTAYQFDRLDDRQPRHGGRHESHDFTLGVIRPGIGRVR
jgi:hypothetical protein